MWPLEQALNGAAGVEAVRSSAGIGVSVIFVEFAWDTRVQDDRQVVSERLATVVDHLPDGVQPKMAPLSSIMGQIMLVGMHVESGSEEGQEARVESEELRDESEDLRSFSPNFAQRRCILILLCVPASLASLR